MKPYLYRVLLVVLLIATIVPAWAADDDGGKTSKSQFHVSRGQVTRGMGYFTLQGIEVPDLIKTEADLVALAGPVDRVAATGANTVCFDLYGFSADGASLSPEGLAALRKAVGQLTWRRLGSICRLFPADAPTDPAYRLAAVRAAGKALAKDGDSVYWIDGSNCAELVAAFKEAAPKLVVAAREGGDILVVTEEPKTAPEVPVLLVGVLPADPHGRTNYLLPAADASYDAIDKIMADPSESKPWEPDNSVLTPEERADGWIALFDGKTLDGWWSCGTNKQGFEVQDSCIVWTRPGGVLLLTHDRYDNFILRLEWSIDEGGNSGIFLRAPRTGRQSKMGMEFQLQGDYGTPPEEHITGAIYDVVSPLKNAGKPAGEWNNLEIMLDGPKLKATLNGEVVQDLNLDDNPELKYRLRKGFIGIQDHGHPVHVRNIRLKKL